MKKLLIITLAFILTFSIAACGKAQTDNPASNMPNPMVEKESLEVLNEEFGCRLALPSEMDATDEKFFGIEGEVFNIAEYDFSSNGQDYKLRFSPTTEDISGIYVGGKTIFQGFEGDVVAAGGGMRAARWYDVNGQYVLMVNDSVDAADFEMIASKVQDATYPGMSDPEKPMYYQALEGMWADRFSQRATMDIVAIDDGVEITVHWGSSASEATQWTMTARYYEDELLSYTDCRETNITSDEAGKESDEVVYENGSGFFRLGNDGVLYWEGASDANCVDCEFEKIDL